MSPPKMPRHLELVRGGNVIGTIDVKPGDEDFPWFSGAFEPSPEFEAVRALFAQELRLLRANTENDANQWDAWESVHGELHGPGLRLESLDRTFAAEDILIHIDGAQAWWRTE